MSCNYKTNIKDIQSKYTFKIFCAGDTSQIEQEIGNLSDLTTTAKNNLVSAINEVDGDLSAKEDKSNKVTTITSSSTDTQYPSAKLLYNQLALKENVANKTTTLSSSSTDTQYPSAKAVYDSQETQNETISTLESNLKETQEELDYYKTIYNVLPKVSGNGESITLNNTAESILKLDTRGQCKQDSTIGKNIFNPALLSQESGYNTYNSSTGLWTTSSKGSYYRSLLYDISGGGSNKDITKLIKLKANTNYTIKFYDYSTTITGSEVFRFGFYDSTGVRVDYVDKTTAISSFTTPNQDCYLDILRIPSSGTFTFSKIMIVEGTYTEETMPDFEKYTGGIPAPSPSYPQQIHEVSGDNAIEVSGKNRLNPALLSQVSGYNTYNSATGLWTTNTGTNTSYNRSIFYDAVGYSENRDASKIIKVKPSTNYTLRFYDTTNVNYTIGLYTSDGTFITAIENISTTDIKTFSTPNNCERIDIRRQEPNTQLIFSKIMLIEGTYTSETIPPYEPYGDTYELDLGTLKMRGIGTYEDYFVRNSGKNLFNGTYVNAYTTAASPYTFSSSANSRSGIIKVEPNTTYTISKVEASNRFRIGEYSSQPEIGVSTATNFINTDGTTTYTFTTGSTTQYLAIQTTSEAQENVKMQVELGNQATTYEPYGTGLWCKYNAIWEIDLGTLNYSKEAHQIFGDYFWATISNVKYQGVYTSTTYASLCSSYIPSPRNTSLFINNRYCFDGAGTNVTQIQIKNSDYSDASSFKASLNGVMLYVPLATPYLSLIESETLQSQLDAIEKALGKDGTTNISQVNNDTPFKIYASALMKISGE